ncbi:chemotaxis protein CheB [Sphingomonas qilianensis]|uniref:protein-glutamate methylesterase n=1 Tax=Sphingomonas qilianensis TaxID=1736690 RepID=A0ABU9XQX8_9SPHN
MSARSTTRVTANGRDARLLIVDDSAVARAVIARMLAAKSNFVVVAAVAEAGQATEFLRRSPVDLILLDIDIPGANGLSALPDLIAAGGGAPILVISSSCAAGGPAAVQALALGAADTLEKPPNGALAGRFADDLIDKLRLLLASETAGAPAARRRKIAPDRSESFDIVAIGASTGGIHALSQVLREIPASFRQPILITQHLPSAFMPYFAQQTTLLAQRPCEVATDRMRIVPGRVLIAPGDGHLRIVALGDGAAAVRLTREATRSGCMPSVDPMFESVAEVFGARALCIVLSGMGRDGSVGAHRAAAAGGCIVVQDRDSSVVWGMPGAVAAAGDASAVLTPPEIGRLIATRQRPT